ncbi:MAG: hypothetical protein Q8R45_12105 [Brevundimonas sp.]|uniref:hypothetical protein n=1 Tax=Brevundimonas sp. TaxID=1871086 RepID=UPI00271C4239|nr:hypothetical protein [Brevundimonas sp.]MDO9588989.1 hypothetical protein [Brevundimonas sp.]MDP3657693.1 hypothetical protein [Brevundimonas sp.]MDZ4113120.1 hypothetical protein [Brevundimonas sp.]
MLKKFMLAATVMAAILAPVAPAAADDYEACMLRNGCFFYTPSDSSPGYWVCPNPPEQMECVGP